MEFYESQTKKNMARAFAGLCQDSARLQFISKDACNDGFASLGKLLYDMADCKIGQAKRIYEIINENLQQKKDNIIIEAGYPFEECKIKVSLNQTATTEEYESKNLYPQFALIARDEGFGKIEELFMLIANVSLRNSKILKTLSNYYDKHTLYTSTKEIIWKCSNCGNSIKAKSSWKVCPLCQKPKGYVVIPEEKLLDQL